MWTVIGYPPVTPAIPVWVKGAEKKLPRLLTVDKENLHCPLCDMAGMLRERIYGYHRGTNTENYFNWELLFNRAGDGYMQRTEETEDKMFSTLYERITGWRKDKSPSLDDIYKLYDDCDIFVAGELYSQINNSK
jgi:hypothetical protein